jgi:uncharacterized protein YabE (DUF348 family)
MCQHTTPIQDKIPVNERRRIDTNMLIRVQHASTVNMEDDGKESEILVTMEQRI